VTWGNVKGTSVCNPRRRSALGLQARECLNERANLQNETEWKHQSINQKSSKRKPIIFVYPVKNPKPSSHATFHEGINQSINQSSKGGPAGPRNIRWETKKHAFLRLSETIERAKSQVHARARRCTSSPDALR
jgi:hypothetical protein